MKYINYLWFIISAPFIDLYKSKLVRSILMMAAVFAVWVTLFIGLAWISSFLPEPCNIIVAVLAGIGLAIITSK